MLNYLFSHIPGRFFFLLVSFFFLSGPPAGFSAEINLAWDPNTEPDLAGYKIYFGTAPAPRTYAAPVYFEYTGNEPQYPVKDLTPGQTYYFVVTASDLFKNESGPSNEFSEVAVELVQTYVITTNPLNLKITVDGTTYNAPQTFSWLPASSHTLSVPSPQGGAESRYVFTSWSDGGALSHTITTPSSGSTYTANFKTQYSLSASSSPSGGGTVSPSGLNWYDSGQPVSVLATANAGYDFLNWTGNLTGSNNPESVTMTGPRSVTANFKQNQYTLTVNTTGTGSVSRSPDKATYVYGETVQLNAAPGTGWSFSAWGGGGSGTANPLTITVNGNKSVTATFTQNQYSLTVNTTGTGTVSRSPDKATYVYGDTVQLTAAPGTGWAFSVWGGDGSGAANPLTVTMSGPKTVTATFTQNPPVQYSLMVNVNGSGSVGKSPNKSAFDQGETASLMATPGSGYAFSNWSVDASGTTNPVTVTMNGNKTVTANFTKISFYQHTLTVYLNGTGSVTKKTDKSAYNRWESVTLTATPGSGYTFSNWSGDASGASNPITVTMSTNKKVTANFVKGGSLTVSPSGDLKFSGPQGGPFQPSNQTYTLKNIAASAVQWMVSKYPGWVSLSLMSGSLAPGGSVQITISPSSAAKQLRAGTYYKDSVVFSNVADINDKTSKTIILSINYWGRSFSSTADPTVNRDPKGVNLQSGSATEKARVGSIEETNVTSEESTDLPMIAELESPQDGKSVLGVKTIYGWALDGEGIARVKLFIDGEHVCDIPYGGLREDLKEAYPDYPNAEKGGFALVWNYSSLSPGSHLVEIEIVNVRGATLKLAANVLALQLPGEMLTQISPNEWLIRGVNLTIDGNTGTYDLRLEWSNESQAFEIVDLYPQ